MQNVHDLLDMHCHYANTKYKERNSFGYFFRLYQIKLKNMEAMRRKKCDGEEGKWERDSKKVRRERNRKTYSQTGSD